MHIGLHVTLRKVPSEERFHVGTKDFPVFAEDEVDISLGPDEVRLQFLKLLLAFLSISQTYHFPSDHILEPAAFAKNSKFSFRQDLFERDELMSH